MSRSGLLWTESKVCVLTKHTSFSNLRIDLSPLNWFTLLYCAWAHFFRIASLNSEHPDIAGYLLLTVAAFFLSLSSSLNRSLVEIIKRIHHIRTHTARRHSGNNDHDRIYMLVHSFIEMSIFVVYHTFIICVYLSRSIHDCIESASFFRFVVWKYHSNSIHSIHLWCVCVYVSHLAKQFYRCKCYGILRNMTMEWTSFWAKTHTHTLTRSSCSFRPLIPLPWYLVFFGCCSCATAAVERDSRARKENDRKVYVSVYDVFIRNLKNLRLRMNVWIQLRPV